MLDQFTPMGPVDITGASGIKNTDGGSAKEQLEAEIKLLDWHKLANEAALKAALIRTKNLRKVDREEMGKKTNSLQEKKAWMTQVIEEEQRKPLQCGKDYLKKYAEAENRREERLQSEVERQVAGLRKLQEQLKEREQHCIRRERYKEQSKILKEEKKRMAHGKYGDVGTVTQPVEKKKEKSDTLTTVVNSLGKLIELEKRITGLENDNLYDRMGDSAAFPSVAHAHASEAVPTVFGDNKPHGGRSDSLQRQTGPLRFTKKHTPMSLNTPSKTVFSVKVAPNSRNRGGSIGGRKSQSQGYRVKPIPKAGASLAALKNKGKKSTFGAGRGARSQPIGSSTFMTGVPSSSSKQKASTSRLSGGGSNVSINRRDKGGQDAQISSWLQQKKKGRTSGRMGGVGDKSGGRSNLRGYQELRSQMDKRKDDLRKNLARGGTKGGTTSLPSIRQRGSASSSTNGSMFTGSKSVSSSRTRASSLTRSSSTGNVGLSSSLTRGSGIGKTANNTGTRLPRVGGTGGTGTKARRKAW
jgi:hypothetical protein